LKNFNVEIALLTSDSSLADRKKIIADLQSGKTKIIVGTHSLIQEEINFANLGFIVIDEQQRFGVEQRRKIREKGLNPDLLIMTATPIPRTMAISMFENTELSIIKEKPKNRKPIKTKIIDFENLNEAFNLVDKELKSNRQIYVVCPLIEDNQDNKNVSVEEAFKLLSKRFKNTNIAMLHGKMTEQEKSSIFNDFTTHKIQILISTTVIEVGVNVKNASIMIIFNANSFGLSQIHQLRGRVGRNEYSGYCYLVVDDLVSDLERLKILEESNDGFKISEFDLEIRGPGEVFGKQQSGVPIFQFANIISDVKLREAAFSDAKTIIKNEDYRAKNLVRSVLQTIKSYNLD
jgi:ATP-dependent DNA helicase RecG